MWGGIMINKVKTLRNDWKEWRKRAEDLKD